MLRWFYQHNCYSVDVLMCVCVCSRGGAGAGGEAALAIQRVPTGAQRVPTAAPETTQVPLCHHVTPTWTPVSLLKIRTDQLPMTRVTHVQKKQLCFLVDDSQDS